MRCASTPPCKIYLSGKNYKSANPSATCIGPTDPVSSPTRIPGLDNTAFPRQIDATGRHRFSGLKAYQPSDSYLNDNCTRAR